MLLLLGQNHEECLNYLKTEYSIKDSDVFFCEENDDLDFSKRCLVGYEKALLYAKKNNTSCKATFNKNHIIVMCDSNPALSEEYQGIYNYADDVVMLFSGTVNVLKSKTTKIYLLRHGLTSANKEHLYCGHFDVPLLDEGIEELKKKKNKISYPNAKNFTCYTSSRKRTKETFEELFGDVPYSEIPEFDEINFGSFEMRGYTADLENDPDFIIWTAGDNESNVCPYGESSLMMRRRVFAKFDTILAKGEDSIIVSHGGPIVALFKRYMPDSGLNFYDLQPKNGEGYLLEFAGKRFVRYERITEE